MRTIPQAQFEEMLAEHEKWRKSAAGESPAEAKQLPLAECQLSDLRLSGRDLTAAEFYDCQWDRVSLTDALAVAADPAGTLPALDDALTRLEQIDPEQARIVELRYFAGLSIEETAEALKISPITVTREWRSAKAWLRREMSRESEKV